MDRGRGGAVFERIGAGLSRRWEVSDVLFETHTGFQNLLIGRTGQGVALFCDDERQSTEASQLIYHEALMVPPMLLAGRRRRVLVIGSSEGVLSRIAADEGAEVDHVDIDRVAVRACAEHLPYGYTPEILKAAERGQGPIRVHYQDGWEFVARSDGGYDLVLVDLPDEHPGSGEQYERLYSTEFLRRCASLLAPEGVVAGQAGSAIKQRNGTLINAWRRFREVFGTTVYYGSDEHGWAFLSGRLDEVPDPLAVMTERLGELRYRPETIDAEALRGNTVPPLSVRRS
ncbi:spermidine synthase [Amycolatopsis pigmentata]|uniref:Polyamine aminopropyltransferase n=1 Tax=Amycolatopsis pigmentata TaxID=450801 RepID=A0ABW5FX64_9PSEU